MWHRLGLFVLKYRVILLILLGATTALMGYYASKVKLSYEFSKAIPTYNEKYKEYKAFREKFGDDGNILVVGIRTDRFFDLGVFKAYSRFQQELKQVSDVQNVLAIPSAVILKKDTLTEKLVAFRIFADTLFTQGQLDSARRVFLNIIFYRSVLYNPETNAYLMAVAINKDTLNSPKRTKVIAGITAAAKHFEETTHIETHLSGLPLIRTVVADRIQKEMKLFLLGSLLLSAFILMLFFRSVSTMILSLAVVLLGVIWSLGILYLCGYNITLLTGIIAPLVVVIGVPNCIYFINKYHTSWLKDEGAGEQRKRTALVEMVSRMGVVTLFCNITAAIGFGVFALTQSAILKEFGVVAGLSIMMIFIISFVLLPTVLSFLPSPNSSQTKYLSNRWITGFLLQIEKWVVNHKKPVFIWTGLLLLVAIVGIFKLKTVAYIVDDLPKTDKVYTDLKFFEKNFRGVMPLEIVVDTKVRRGLKMKALSVFGKLDSLSQYIRSQRFMSRPLDIGEGLKFANQALHEGDSTFYVIPDAMQGAFVADYLRPSGSDSGHTNGFGKMLTSFMDTAMQSTRMSVNMVDVGTVELPVLLGGVEKRAQELFDTAHYKVLLTGTSITFLEGSKFIIEGLKASIGWAFLLIALCMLYLFRSFRILVCSLIPNIIPLVLTAGIMGWAGVPLKPSTVLVFSVALGIAIDVTIRFLVNYKQELEDHSNDANVTVKVTINQTGLSIVYTALVLIAGFVIFCFSDFGGTKALGWLTSLTLLTATLTNLILLPVLLLVISPSGKRKTGNGERVV